MKRGRKTEKRCSSVGIEEPEEDMIAEKENKEKRAEEEHWSRREKEEARKKVKA